MTAITVEVHTRFIGALGDRVLRHGDVGSKPLDVDLAPPLPTSVRLYMFSLVEGGASRPHEYKAVLRVPGQRVGEYASFKHGGHRLAVLCAYRDDLDVFVVWDASLHPRFKQGGNVRVDKDVVLRGAATGWAEQRRRVRLVRSWETIYACQPRYLERALRESMLTGGGDAVP
ncbi:MAG TPA: hypothetical protein VGK17_07930 [Propionicimonas sp.]|jgi:hypothetical protein